MSDKNENTCSDCEFWAKSPDTDTYGNYAICTASLVLICPMLFAGIRRAEMPVTTYATFGCNQHKKRA